MEAKIVPLRTRRRARKLALDSFMAAALALVGIEALLFLGLLAAFLLTRATAAVAWPPRPWFPAGETALNTAALLTSGALVFRAARTWENPRVRIAPLLFAAILLGAFFLIFQGVVWQHLLRDGLSLASSHHGRFFCLIVALHAAHSIGALGALAVVWARLRPLRDDGAPHRLPLRESGFSGARVLWYFAVAAWPVLYLVLYR